MRRREKSTHAHRPADLLEASLLAHVAQNRFDRVLQWPGAVGRLCEWGVEQVVQDFDQGPAASDQQTVTGKKQNKMKEKA